MSTSFGRGLHAAPGRALPFRDGAFDAVVCQLGIQFFPDAGFRDIRVEQIRRENSIGGFDDYWAPIEEGIGSIPAYHSLGEADHRSVREEVRARLAQYESSDGKLSMGIETLIGSGRA